MAQAKSRLARKGTMQTTAKDAVPYLYPDKPSVDEFGKRIQSDYLKHGSKELLRSQGIKVPDLDPLTRKVIPIDKDDTIEDKGKTSGEPPAKKARLTKNVTMVATAKEAEGLLGKEKLGNTRQVTTKRAAGSAKTSLKRDDSIGKTLKEAKYLLDGKDVDMSEGRKTRSAGKSPPAKPAMKRAGTMQKTAKEGKSYLRRTKGNKGKGKK